VLIAPVFILVEKLDPEILELRHIQSGRSSLLDQLITFVEPLFEASQGLVGIQAPEWSGCGLLHQCFSLAGADQDARRIGCVP